MKGGEGKSAARGLLWMSNNVQSDELESQVEYFFLESKQLKHQV